MSIRKVFISYSHDTPEHKKWVLDLATRLRSFGIDATLDQWELKAGDDIPKFMETHLVDSDYILMVCTTNYVEKANNGTGGVGYEKMIVTSSLMKNIDSNKVIPIIRQSLTKNVPIFLQTKLYIDFSADNNFEFAFDELARTIISEPAYKKPELGNNPFASTDIIEPKKTVEPLLELMKAVVSEYETSAQVTYNNLVKKMGISKIMVDLLIDEAINKKFIIFTKDTFSMKLSTITDTIELTIDGKKYAVENKLI